MYVNVTNQNVGTGTAVSLGGNQIPGVSGVFDVDYISNPESSSLTSGYTFAAVTAQQLPLEHGACLDDGRLGATNRLGNHAPGVARLGNTRRRRQRRQHAR